MKAFFSKLKFHHYFYVFGTLIALVALFGTSAGAGFIKVPFGADVISKLSSLPALVFAVLAIWLGSRALYSYVDMEKLLNKAMETPEGAAQAYIGVNIGRVSLSIAIIGIIAAFA